MLVSELLSICGLYDFWTVLLTLRLRHSDIWGGSHDWQQHSEWHFLASDIFARCRATQVCTGFNIVKWIKGWVRYAAAGHVSIGVGFRSCGTSVEGSLTSFIRRFAPNTMTLNPKKDISLTLSAIMTS